MKDPYKVLGLTKAASPEEVKKSYRLLAMKYHPDRNPGDERAKKRYLRVQEAYDILNGKNPNARKQASITFMEELIGSLELSIEWCGKNRKSVTTENILERMSNILEEVRDELVEKIEQQIPEKKKKLGQVCERISTTEEDNILKGLIENQMRHLDKQLEMLKQRWERTNLAIEYLKKYKYQVDKGEKDGLELFSSGFNAKWVTFNF